MEKGGAKAPPLLLLSGKMNQNREKNEGYPQRNYKLPLDKRDKTVYNNHTQPEGSISQPVR